MRVRPSQERGITLIEILVALAIMGMMLSSAIFGFRAIFKSELRGTAGRLAAAIRYSYDRAITTGAYYRLHFDLDRQTYKLERSSDRIYLRREKERAGRNGAGLDQDQVAKEEQEERERHAGGSKQGLPPELLLPPSPRVPRFEAFKDATLPEIKLKRIHVVDLYTPRQKEPYTTGHAYLHFFPDGHTERAVIHLGAEPGDSSQYTLIVHALTGRVEVKAERVLPAGSFDTADDAGNQKADR